MSTHKQEAVLIYYHPVSNVKSDMSDTSSYYKIEDDKNEFVMNIYVSWLEPDDTTKFFDYIRIVGHSGYLTISELRGVLELKDYSIKNIICGDGLRIKYDETETKQFQVDDENLQSIKFIMRKGVYTTMMTLTCQKKTKL